MFGLACTFLVTLTVTVPASAAKADENTERVGEGPALVNPYGIVITGADDTTYVIDRGSSSVFRVDLATGDRTIVSGPNRGDGKITTEMRGVGLEPSGASLLVVDSSLKAVLRIDIASGDRTVVSDATRGTGPELGVPRGLTVARNGEIFVTDFSLDAVLKINPVTGNRQILSGPTSSGTIGAGPELRQPHGIHVAADGILYVNDVGWPAVIGINSTSGDRRLVSGTGPVLNVGSGPELSSLRGLTTSGPDTVIVVDFDQNEVISIDVSNGDRVRISGPGVGRGVDLGLPVDAAVTSTGQIIVCDFTPSSLISVDSITGNRALISFVPRIGLQIPLYVAVLPSGRIIASDTGRKAIWIIDSESGDRAILSAEEERGGGDPFILPMQMVVLADGNVVVVDDGADAVVRVDFATGNRTTISGNGIGTGIQFVSPRSLLQKSDGNFVVFDTGLAALLNVNAKSGDRVLLSGSSRGSGPLIHNVNSIGLLADGAIIVGDSRSKMLTVNPVNGDRQMIQIDSDNVAITEPWGLAVTSSDLVYVTYYQGSEAAVARISPEDGAAQLVSGVSETPAKHVGGGADMRSPAGCAVDAKGNLILSDFYYGTLLRIEIETGNRFVVTNATTGKTVDFDVLTSGSKNLNRPVYQFVLLLLGVILVV